MRELAAFSREDNDGNAPGLPSPLVTFYFVVPLSFFPLPPPLFSPFLSFLLVHAFGVSKHVATRWKKSPVRKNDRNTFRVGWGEGHVDAPRIKGRFSASSLSFLSYSSLFFSRRFVFFFFLLLSSLLFPPPLLFVNTGIPQRGFPSDLKNIVLALYKLIRLMLRNRRPSVDFSMEILLHRTKGGNRAGFITNEVSRGTYSGTKRHQVHCSRENCEPKKQKWEKMFHIHICV